MVSGTPDFIFVSGVMRNLISVSEATKRGTTIQFTNYFVVSHELPIGEMLKVTCHESRRLYPLQMVDKTPIQALFASSTTQIDPTML